jgi:hypothetical protein
MSDTHLVGTLDVRPLAVDRPMMADFDTEPWQLGQIEVIHINYEISSAAIQSSLPPALHPSIPPHLSWLVYQVDDSEHGPFALVQTRVGCRIGLKPRGLLLSAVCDNPAVSALLSARWGFHIQTGAVALRQRADQIELRVDVAGRENLAVDIVDPRLLPGGAVPIAAGLNLARTPAGIRLVQVDPDYEIASAERGDTKIRHFDAAAWGDAQIIPTWPISASRLSAHVTLPRLRFITDPNATSASGTTRLPDRGGSQ